MSQDPTPYQFKTPIGKWLQEKLPRMTLMHLITVLALAFILLVSGAKEQKIADIVWQILAISLYGSVGYYLFSGYSKRTRPTTWIERLDAAYKAAHGGIYERCAYIIAVGFALAASILALAIVVSAAMIAAGMRV